MATVLAAERVVLDRRGALPLMLAAATAVAVQAVSMLPRPIPGNRVVLLIGSGNNGGDALYAGADLARRGIRVTALCTESARVHAGGLAAFRAAGGHLGEIDDAPAHLAVASLVIDGLVGIGGHPPLRPAAERLVVLANAAPGARLAVDLPSGVDPDGATTAGPVFQADRTVTTGGLKTGLLTSSAAGTVVLVTLDFPLSGAPFDVMVLDDEDALPAAGGSEASKYTSGVVGIAAGSPRYPGAAVLCVGGAVRTRPGMVRFAGAGRDAVLARWPEVVVAESVPASGRVQAWVVGPGMGGGGPAVDTLRAALDVDVPVLVDADGLTLLAAEPELLERRRAPTVLTPHAGEFARLWPDLDPDDRLASVREAARRSGTVVLLKGHRTVIAAPDGRTAINLTGTPWLASAGSGDVLSGVIGSLLATGRDPLLAAAAGAHLHGRAGERAERAGHAGAQALWNHLRTDRRS